MKSDGVKSALLRSKDYIEMVIPRPTNIFRYYRRIYVAIQFADLKMYTSCDINKKLPASTRVPHRIGIVVGKKVQIGENVQIGQNVTLGGRGRDNTSGHPTIEDNVTIWAGAMVLGDVTIGEGAVIGANSVVLDDIDCGSTAVGSPATVVKD